VHLYFETSPLVLPQAEAGKVRVLAIAGSARLAQLPDVPTTRESGLPSLTGGFWSGVLAPAGTDPEIIDLLNAAINDAMQTQQVQQTLAKIGAQAQCGSPADFRAFIADETRKWTAVIDAADLPQAKPAKVAMGSTEVMLYRDAGGIHALANRCSHRGGPLHKGTADRESVTCPWHLSVFRLKDGAVLRGPATAPQPSYQVRVREGSIEVRERSANEGR